MSGTFDFCPTSRVITEIPPEEPTAVSFNGWEFTSAPVTPYRRSFSVKLYGLRWYLNSTGNALDTTTNPYYNAGRLLDFYRTNRQYGVFDIDHEYLGNIICRFANPVIIPAARPNSDGLTDEIEIKLLHYNPGF